MICFKGRSFFQNETGDDLPLGMNFVDMFFGSTVSDASEMICHLVIFIDLHLLLQTPDSDISWVSVVSPLAPARLPENERLVHLGSVQFTPGGFV